MKIIMHEDENSGSGSGSGTTTGTEINGTYYPPSEPQISPQDTIDIGTSEDIYKG